MRLANGIEVNRINYLGAVAKWRGRKARDPWSFAIRVKTDPLDDALTASDTDMSNVANTGAFDGIVPPDYFSWVGPPSRPLMIASVLGAASTSSNVVRVIRESETGDAEVTGEGDPYAQVVMTAAVDDTAKVIDTTVLLFVSENLLADSPTAGPYLTSRLTYLVSRKEEAALVAGAGDKTGLINATDAAASETATTYTQTTEPIAEAVANVCMRTYDASGLIPSFIVMSPATYFEHIVARSSAGAGQFLAGPPGVVSSRAAWGMSLVVTGALDDATVLVGSREAATRHVRDLTVRSSSGYGLAYGQGVIAVRAKLRSALSFERPSGIGVLTLANASELLGS